LVFRLWLVDKAWHVDILSNAGWGEWIFDHGPGGFYENSAWTYSWPTQPPLTNLVYAWDKRLHVELLGRAAWLDYQLNRVLPGEKVPWLTDFVRWFGYGKINNEIPFQIGYLMTIKLIPILADLGIAVLIYYFCGRRLLWPTVFLISPFSWYVSAMWGQYDSVGFLFALSGFVSLFTSFNILGPGLLVLAILIKPTSLIFLPFFVYLFWRKKRSWLAWIIPLVIFWVTTQPFTHKNPLEFARYDLIRIVFEKSEPRVSVNAFNFWRIFIGDKAVNSGIKILGLSVYSWGLIAFAVINISAIVIFRKEKEEDAVRKALFVIGAGSFLFMTGMLDRYLYAGMVFGLIYVSGRRKLYELWAVWSIIFWVNLYYHWWIPESLETLKNLLLAENHALTRILSLAAAAIFIAMVNPGLLPKLTPENFHKLRCLLNPWRRKQA